MRQPLVAGNWKMNGSKASVETLLQGIKAGLDQVRVAEAAVCPPFVYLAQVEAALAGEKRISWGAQNVSTESSGAFTGEISAEMLKDFACTYVIVGHSERRALYGETDALVAQKFAVARAAGLVPILCVGETLDEREQNITEQVVARQLDAVLNGQGVAALEGAVVAYEPVWAIGTGRTASPEQAQEVHAFIRGRVGAQDAGIAGRLRILYGGSMKGDNAADLLGQTDIDGGLVGGASLKAEEFMTICRAAG